MLNYSTPGYSPGKLVDEFGQGSSNDSYGRTVVVTATEQVDLYALDPTIPYGAVRANRVPWFRNLDMLGGITAIGLAILGHRSSALIVGGLVVADVVGRRVSPNFDAAMSMIPFNRAAEA
ncbi:MAG: hypothetical protein EPN91_08480 [Salinibacterium sp.]|nr:MAG: hypothetical protein EPN91_08480 [Salinibacterium sp.]